MAEDGIPEILAEQRLGHDVPGMRGLYTHVSDTMRHDLTAKLQARWETSLKARAAIHPRSPLPLLDELLAPYRAKPRSRAPARQPGGGHPRRHPPREPGKDDLPNSSQPGEDEPAQGQKPARLKGVLPGQKAKSWVELRGFEPLTPSMRTRCATGLRYSPKTVCQRSKSWQCSAPGFLARSKTSRPRSDPLHRRRDAARCAASPLRRVRTRCRPRPSRPMCRAAGRSARHRWCCRR